QAEDGSRGATVTGVQTCDLPILAFGPRGARARSRRVRTLRVEARITTRLAFWRETRCGTGRAFTATFEWMSAQGLFRGLQSGSRSEGRRVGKECWFRLARGTIER